MTFVLMYATERPIYNKLTQWRFQVPSVPQPPSVEPPAVRPNCFTGRLVNYPLNVVLLEIMYIAVTHFILNCSKHYNLFSNNLQPEVTNQYITRNARFPGFGLRIITPNL